MDDTVEYRGEEMSYREYLIRHQPIVLSQDVAKFCEFQDAIAEYFLGDSGSTSIPSTRKLASLAPKNIRGGSELDNFRCSLSMLEAVHCMIKMGYYNTSVRILQATSIAASVLLSHRSGGLEFDDNGDLEGSKGADSLNDHGEKDESENSEEEDDGEDRSSNSSDAANIVSNHPDNPVYLSIVDGDEPQPRKHGPYIDTELYLPLKSEFLPTSKKRTQKKGSTADKKSVGDMDKSSGKKNIHDSQYSDVARETITALSDLQTTELKTNKERRGMELTRLCQRHDDAKQPQVVVEHIYENQR